MVRLQPQRGVRRHRGADREEGAAAAPRAQLQRGLAGQAVPPVLRRHRKYAPLPPPPVFDSISDARALTLRSARPAADPLYPPLARTQTIPLKLKTPRFVRRALARLRRQLPNLDPKSLLPVSFEGTKGAILCGNASTPSVLVAEFQRAEGIFGIVPVRAVPAFCCFWAVEHGVADVGALCRRGRSTICTSRF